MKKRIVRVLGLISIPAGALLFNACGPAEIAEDKVALDETSDNWTFINGWFSEYGHCNNATDDDGDGLRDFVDPDCHVNPGPLRDLSIYDFPIGHNFFPDIRMDLPGGPGFLGGFRDPAMTTRWLRFLTEPDNNTAGIDLIAAGVNPEVVPVPEILPLDTDQGSMHQGNNNNVSIRALHVWDMFHPGIAPPPPALAAAAAQAPASDAAAKKKPDESSVYEEKVYTYAKGPSGGKPGVYAPGALGGWTPDRSRRGGSQGAAKPARTGNGD